MLRRTSPRFFGRWWFGVCRRRANGLQYVAVEKDDGSNFAFEYGDMTMLHYRSQDILASTFSQAHGWTFVGLGGGH